MGDGKDALISKVVRDIYNLQGVNAVYRNALDRISRMDVSDGPRDYITYPDTYQNRMIKIASIAIGMADEVLSEEKVDDE